MKRVKVAIVGGGPAGIAAAIEAGTAGASVLLVDSDSHLGGKLKQSIFDEFGMSRHGVRLTGPEYAFRDISALELTNCLVLVQTHVFKIVRLSGGFQLTMSCRHGIVIVEADCIVLATGSREITDRQFGLHGTRPSGLMTAGTAQYFMNILGQLPTQKCAILGSSDLALSVARQLTQEGAGVIAVYEPGDALRCKSRLVKSHLTDFDIPINLSTTVRRLFGSGRLRGIQIARTDRTARAVKGTERNIRCDGLIVALGLHPNSDIAESLDVVVDDRTKLPLCDQNNMTLVDGVFVCGSALFPGISVDDISESGKIAGIGAAIYVERERALVKISQSKDFLCISPTHIDTETFSGSFVLSFRTRDVHRNPTIAVSVDRQLVFTKKYSELTPSEPKSVNVILNLALTSDSNINITIKQEAESDEEVPRT